MRRILELLLCLIGLSSLANATGYGTLNNFDCVNDNGVECHGFEIEIDDCRSTDITYTYDYNHYGTPKISEDDADPSHPKCFIRYASAKNPDGSWAAYTAIPSGPILPTDGHQFTNPSINFGGEHFGAGYYGAPSAVIYHWLIDDGAGNLVYGNPVDIGTPTFVYLPPAGNLPGRVQADLRAPPEEFHVREFGQPSWLKVITTQSHSNHRVKLEDLVSEDPENPAAPNWKNGEPNEVEVEWQLLQTEFAAADGGANGGELGPEDELPNGDEVITRRYEFYKYTGPVDLENGEAGTDNVGPDGIHGVGTKTINGVVIDLSTVEVVGNYIGAQMAGFDAEDKLGLIANLQEGEIDVPYLDRRVVIGGAAPVLAEVSGDLPDGMELDPVTGILSGTPTVSGAFTFTLSCNDGDGAAASATYTLQIEAAPVQQWNVSTSASPAIGGSASGGGAYDDGALATVTATANPGFEFVDWTEDGFEVATTPEYQFTADADHVLVANFVEVPVPVFRNVDDLISIGESGQSTTLDRRTRKLTSVSNVTVTNASDAAIDLPLQLVVTGVAGGVAMPGASGVTAGGDFFFDLQTKLGIDSLAPGDSATIAIQFVYPMTSRVSYGLEFWGTAP